MSHNRSLTQVERFFSEDEIIVSKTDLAGRLTYVNDIFMAVSGYQESELIGQPHSTIRHPEMPRCIFKLLWQTIEQGDEIFAYVNNRAKNGDFYWVLAHVTPNLNRSGNIVGYHSNRRVPKRESLTKVIPIYRKLLDIEQSAPDRKVGQDNAYHALTDLLAAQGKSYGEFVFDL